MAKRSVVKRDVESSRPIYELQAIGLSNGQLLLEIWQLPSPATPRLTAKERTATLKGRALEIVESKVLRQLKYAGIRIPSIKKGDVQSFPLDEDIALNMALLFRTLAPMRSIERIRQIATGIDEMTREEAGYWLGMAVHRKYPRRVLAALRILLTA